MLRRGHAVRIALHRNLATYVGFGSKPAALPQSKRGSFTPKAVAPSRARATVEGYEPPPKRISFVVGPV